MADNGEIKIEKGVPMPKSRYADWPFARMKVGDSFEWDGDATALRQAASQYSRRKPPFKYTSRKISDTAYRVWRIE